MGTKIEESYSFAFCSRNYMTDRKRDDDVIEESMPISKAFAKFALAEHDTSDVDFTGNVTSIPLTDRSNFRAEPSYSEVPTERFKRINQELKNLKKDLGTLKDAQSGKDVDDLIAVMQSLKANEMYAPVLNLDFSLSSDDAQSKGAVSALREEIAKIESKKEKKEDSQEMGGASYKFYGLHGGQVERGAEIVALDKRLGVLESTIGTSRLEMMPDIRTGVRFIQGKMEGLGKDKMSSAGKKMKGLSRELLNLEKEKDKLAGAKKSDYQKKISELYSMMGRWDQSSQQLPIIAARMQTIKDMVDVGKGSKGGLKALIAEKNKSQDLIAANKDLLVATRKNFSNSLAQMKSMCALEKNLSDLGKKMQKVR